MMLAALLIAAAIEPTWTIHLNRPQVEVPKTLYGIFFEEINCAGDGGIVSELVRNRSFEEEARPRFWSFAEGTKGQVVPRPAVGFNKSCLEVPVDGSAEVRNEGFFGVPFHKGGKYRFRIAAKGAAGQQLEAAFLSAAGKTLGKTKLGELGGAWKVYQGDLSATGTDAKGRFAIRVAGSGTAWIDEVSLTPHKTWKGRPNGFRPDLLEALDYMKPGFVRFPGGCWVEGDTMASAYRWKQTIGDPMTRRTQGGIWGYQSNHALGYLEYLQLCEDLKSEPMFVINCGMSHKENVPMDKMGEFVQDALDAIEYANGSVDTKWGALRAQHGHPKPFNLKYLEVGNENGGPAYEERYALFDRAIRAKYPNIKLIANVWGGTPKQTPLEILDEHYYSTPGFFLSNADRYDGYDRKGPKIYVGEYAVTQGSGTGNLIGALGEAAFMIGMERNSDVVVMSSYAPLFARVEGKAWNPDLIYYDGTRMTLTPSYHVQAMFSRNRPDRTLASNLPTFESQVEPFPAGGVGVGTWKTQAEFKNLEVVSGGRTLFKSEDGSGLKTDSGAWSQAAGSLRQTSAGEGTLAFADIKEQSYTYRVQARKISGDEGFLITVGLTGAKNSLWVNLGGWGNQESAIEAKGPGGQGRLSRGIRQGIETGRWYSIEVDYSPTRVVVRLDGKQILSEAPTSQPTFHAIAGQIGNQTVLKVLNASGSARALNIQLSGGEATGYRIAGEVLTGPAPASENSLDRVLVAPRRVSGRQVGSTFRVSVPAHSLTVYRLEPIS